MRRFIINVNGNSYNVDVEEVGGAAPAAPAPQVSVAATPAAPAPQAAAAPAAPVSQAPAAAAPAAPVGGTQITAPMPGTILDVKVAVGQQVAEGDILMILEAMKMENEIMAPHAGVIEAVSASKGASVETGTLLAVIK